MHDRRIDGVTHTFGNEGVLFMSAMTWWDWETGSIWAQPWGAAIDGKLAGTRLTLLPFELVPWQSWLARQPETKVLVDERADFTYSEQIPFDQFVIGVSIGADATAYYYTPSADAGVTNDHVGDNPVAVFVDRNTRVIHVFLRTPIAGVNKSDNTDNLPAALTFELTSTGESADSQEIRDIETGSIWDIEIGVATEGPLKGTVLQRAPYVTAFDWAWEDFNPRTRFHGDNS